MFGFGVDIKNDDALSKGNGNRELNKPNLGKAIHLYENVIQKGNQSKNEEKTAHTEKKRDIGMPDNNKEEEKTPSMATYNLIILDESGSMSSVRRETISGCNETLNSIRNTARQHPEIKQYVSIFCFDTTNSRYIFQDVPIEETGELTVCDYCPNACTPLYDAIGYTVTQLRRLLVNSESVGVVTIITDGYENASRRWNHHMVFELIDSLKKRGWVFTFIGANIDVERTAGGLGIDSYMEFEQSRMGMSKMFDRKKRSDLGYQEKLRYMHMMHSYNEMSREEREAVRCNMNENYFIEEERVAPATIDRLGNADIFVFGSNVHGQHNGGASLYALEHFGAINGQAEGIQGRSYAIPTVGNTFEELKTAVERFNEFVVLHPHYRFMLTAIGCGAAGYSVEQIAPLFRQAYSFGNVYVPKSFLCHMTKSLNM